MAMFKKITELTAQGDTYIVGSLGNQYVSINSKELDENGRLKRRLGWADLLPASTINGCVQLRKDTLDYQAHLAETGLKEDFGWHITRAMGRL